MGNLELTRLLSLAGPRYSEQGVMDDLPVTLCEIGSTKDHIIVWGSMNKLPLAAVLRCVV